MNDIGVELQRDEHNFLELACKSQWHEKVKNE